MSNSIDHERLRQRLAKARAERLPTSLRRREKKELLFHGLGLSAVCLALGFLAVLLVTIFSQGMSAFYSSYIELTLEYDVQRPDEVGAERERPEQYQEWLDAALLRALDEPDSAVADVRALLSTSALFQVRDRIKGIEARPSGRETLWVLASDEVDLLQTGVVDRSWPEEARQLSDRHLAWIDRLTESERLERRLNRAFFTGADSQAAETAGIWGAVVGSFLTLLVTLVLAFPIGVVAAVYLEEFAPRNRFIDLIELNINSLAAVPSIIFGLLGLAIFINTMGMPRSAPLVGGLVLALITLPTIIITTRSALNAVPASLRDAATGMGASRLQVTLHHVLPMAMPGILTGTIIGLAQALGETAPLLMIGMVAFIADVPASLTDPATVLPVQIFIWSDSPERAFIAKTSAAILVLLGFLAAMNLAAVLLRRRFEHRLK